MKISYNWLQDYTEEKLPPVEKVAGLLTMHAFEVESVEHRGKDTVLDVKVLPDRSHDCLSHRGIALEVALLAGLTPKKEWLNVPTLSVPESNLLKVEVEDEKQCPRFSALVMENIEVRESPDWLKDRLLALGQRSINNIVDVTNYVMFALGQPLHAYDRSKLHESEGGWKLVARKAQDGEVVVALDGKEYTLSQKEMVIADGNTGKALGIAGVKGGKASEISVKTTDIVLEAANFDPIVVRKTAKRLGLRTDASLRFENGITPELTLQALKMVSDLIFQIAGTDQTTVEGLSDVYPRRPSPYKVGVSVEEVEKIIGLDVSQKDIRDILKRRGFIFEEIVNPRENFLKVALSFVGTAYKLGASVTKDSPREFDCSGLVACAAGHSGLGIPRMSIDQYVFCEDIKPEDVQAGDLVFALTDSKGMHIETKEWMPGTPVPEGIDHVAVMLSKDEVFHTSVHNPAGARRESLEEFLKIRQIRGYKRIPGIDQSRFVVTIPEERLDLRMKEDLVEEIGRIYGYDKLEAKPIRNLDTKIVIEKKTHYTNVIRDFFVKEGFSEVYTYAFRNSGEVKIQNPIASDKAYMRANLSEGLLESLALNTKNAELLGLPEVKIFEIGNVFTGKEERTSLAFVSAEPEGVLESLGKLLGQKITSYVGDERVVEINLDELLEKLPEPQEPISWTEEIQNKYKPFSSYPFVLRDIAVFVPEGGDHAEIISTVKQEAPHLLASYRLVDSGYTKEFPEGKKTSFAYRLVFQSMEKTLTDEEVNVVMEKITMILNSKSGWQVR